MVHSLESWKNSEQVSLWLENRILNNQIYYLMYKHIYNQICCQRGIHICVFKGYYKI